MNTCLIGLSCSLSELMYIFSTVLNIKWAFSSDSYIAVGHPVPRTHLVEKETEAWRGKGHTWGHSCQRATEQGLELRLPFSQPSVSTWKVSGDLPLSPTCVHRIDWQTGSPSVGSAQSYGAARIPSGSLQPAQQDNLWTWMWVTSDRHRKSCAFFRQVQGNLYLGFDIMSKNPLGEAMLEHMLRNVCGNCFYHFSCVSLYLRSLIEVQKCVKYHQFLPSTSSFTNSHDL